MVHPLVTHPGQFVSRSLLLPLCGFLALASCSGSGSDPARLEIVSAPALYANPNTWVPLTALVAVETSVPTRIELEFSDGLRTWRVPAARDHERVHTRVPVLGLRAGVPHTIQVIAVAETGEELRASSPLEWTPPRLPADFPPIEVTASQPARMQPGGTMLNLVSPGRGDHMVLLDEQGEVIWYLDDSFLPRNPAPQSFLCVPLPSGNLMLIVERRALLEVTMLGEVVGAWWATGQGPLPPGLPFTPVATDSFHHDLIVLPPGSGADFATLSTEVRAYPNYPTSVTDPTQVIPSASVVGDVVVEFRRDGTIAREHRLLDLLDPYRMCYDSLSNWWDDLYMQPTHDWSHANAVTHVPGDDSLLVSLRHQDAVLKISRTTGLLQWILGPHERWQAPWQGFLLAAAPGFVWNFHQHAPTLDADGSIVVFDNGNHRAVPPATGTAPAASWSRAVDLRIDPRTRTVATEWSHGVPPGGNGASFYSFFVGDADPLPNGNVLVCDGGKMEPPPRGNLYARIVEVTRTSPAEVVFEAFVRDGDPVAPASHFCYRAWRVPSIYR